MGFFFSFHVDIMYTSSGQMQCRELAEIQFIIHVWCILCTSSFSTNSQFRRVISLDPAFLIASKSIPGKVRVLAIKGMFCPFRLLGRVCLVTTRRSTVSKTAKATRRHSNTHRDNSANKVQRKSISQDSLDKHSQNQDMNPNHNRFSPTRPPQTQGLAP